DLAPPVDRHERALSQPIDDPNSVQVDGDAPRHLQFTSRAPSSSGVAVGRTTFSDSSDGTIVTTAGLGAFPLKVTASLGQAGRTDLPALLEALGAFVTEAELPVAPTVEPQSQDPTSLASAAVVPFGFPRRLEATSPAIVCGLALGLELMSAPVLPDFLAYLKARSLGLRQGLALKSYGPSNSKRES